MSTNTFAAILLLYRRAKPHLTEDDLGELSGLAELAMEETYHLSAICEELLERNDPDDPDDPVSVWRNDVVMKSTTRSLQTLAALSRIGREAEHALTQRVVNSHIIRAAR